MRRAWIPLAALALVVALPDVAHACPVCFDASDENRMAFLTTAILLTFLPLGMVGGVGLWIRKRARVLDEEDAAANEGEAPPSGS